MHRIIFLILCLSLIMGGCQAVVYKQSIPISTDPMGASILVDGQPMGSAPANLELTRNQDHIVTLSKPGYKQEDVTIKRVYQAETAMLNAVSQGVNDAQFFKNDSWGMQSGVNTLEQDKQSGKAYILTPGTVKVRLMPLGGIGSAPAPVVAAAPQTSAQSQAPAETQTPAPVAPVPAPVAAGPVDVISIMSSFDRELLDRVLEQGRSGDPQNWTSPNNGWQFTVVPDSAQTMEGFPVRTFHVQAAKDGRIVNGKYPAYRENRNDWRIGYPHDVSSGQPDVAPVNGRAAAFGAAKIATSGLKPIGGSTKLGGSSHTSESFSNGTYTKKTSSTSVKGSVSVDPSSAVDLLEKLSRPEGETEE